MDAYDIFKKLTRGARFTKKSNTGPKSVNNGLIKEIKIEKEEFDDEKSLTEVKKNYQSNDSIVLLSGLKADSAKKQGKKRKLPSENEDIKKKKLVEEAVNHYRNVNNINVVGRHVPEPAKTFDEFNIAPDLIENLKKCGYSEPTPIQKQAVPVMLEGRQLLSCAPTGSGKTAAFLLPIINGLKGPQKKGFRALILCPTRELAKQTQRECLRLSEGREFRVHVISKIKKALTQYGPKSNKKYDILIATPNRICYLLKQDPPALSLANIEWVVIDEADKLFESGNRGFREQLDEIIAACTLTTKKIAMFSATYTPVVAKWCVRNMKGLVRVTVGQRNAATDLVDQKLVFVGNEQGKLLAFRDVIRQGLNPPVLVFVQSKDRAQQLFNELIYDGINVDAIHADRTQLQRDNTVRSFREGKIWVLICTELMARGVDFKGVNLVVNYDFPPSSISYVHRVGRAGRAGRKGEAITFFTLEDTVNLRSIAHVLRESGCQVPPYMLTLKKQPKKLRKQLEVSAPKRANIETKVRKLRKFKKYDESKKEGGITGKSPAKRKEKGAFAKKNSQKVKKTKNAKSNSSEVTPNKSKAKKLGKKKGPVESKKKTKKPLKPKL
ncbi:unnamed protein product [Brassicogethes aeneus]|uniref:Probable ATP-dependent RNA helicase DDX52 n=1 Tax=Brassicogethes aeneus TaxID=1431903 RepID=A0A9P0AUI0_BRAAE|nr:unnamed protein product [Brassicogethes aeneus]